MLEILLALGAALLFAFGTVLQQRGTLQEPEGDSLKAGFLLRLVRKPVWLAGVACDGLGYAAQAAALGVGRLVVVQPLLVASVVFALPLGVKLTGQHVGRRELAAAAAVTAGLAAFMVVSDPEGGVDDATDRAWILGAAVCAGAAALLVLVGLRRSPGVKAALLGTATGVLFGYVAGLTKATVDRFDDGIVAVLADWHVYGLVATSLIGFALMQASLATGALAPSIATTMVFETIVGVAVGIVMLDEELHEKAWGVGVSVASLVLVIAGLVTLARSQGEAEAALLASRESPP